MVDFLADQLRSCAFKLLAQHDGSVGRVAGNSFQGLHSQNPRVERVIAHGLKGLIREAAFSRRRSEARHVDAGAITGPLAGASSRLWDGSGLPRVS